MGQNMSLGQQHQWNSANEAAQASPRQSDLLIETQRLRVAHERLRSVHQNLAGLIGRLYGEGQAEDEGKQGPKPAGALSELNEAITFVEVVASRLDAAVERLTQLA